MNALTHRVRPGRIKSLALVSRRFTSFVSSPFVNYRTFATTSRNMGDLTKKEMPYVRLGNSGLKVSKLILGCMSYGTPKWQSWVLGEEEGMEHIKAAYDAGIQTFDTADVYSHGLSETILGRAIKKYDLPRDEIVVMTKMYYTMGKTPETNLSGISNPEEVGYVNQRGLSRKHIFDSVKHSLERLQLDYIDVLQCHAFDSDTPIEETMRALHDVVQAGHVRYIGMSTCRAYQFHIMQNYAITHNLTPFVSLQNHYSMLYREDEREMIPTLKHFGVGHIPWSPLARGMLARPLSEQTSRGEVDNAIKFLKGTAAEKIVPRVEAIAKKRGVSMAQVSLAWLMAKDGVTAPIIGTTSVEKLIDLVGAVKIELTAEEMKELEEPYEPREAF